MSNPSDDWQRYLELVELSETEGIELPMSIEGILRLEAQGHTVDLDTGEVTFNGANQPCNPPTERGRATMWFDFE